VVGVSTDCCNLFYCGTKALSESEAWAVTDMLGKMREDILAFLTIHSYGQQLLVPYGHPNISAPNHDELVRPPPKISCVVIDQCFKMGINGGVRVF
jgi:hypothetical protein